MKNITKKIAKGLDKFCMGGLNNLRFDVYKLLKNSNYLNKLEITAINYFKGVSTIIKSKDIFE